MKTSKNIKYTGKKEYPGDAKLHFWLSNPYFHGTTDQSVGTKDNWNWKFEVNFDWGNPNCFLGLSFIIRTPVFFWGLYA